MSIVEPITAQEIVDIMEARYAELEQMIDKLPELSEERHKLIARRDELALVLFRIDTKALP